MSNTERQVYANYLSDAVLLAQDEPYQHRLNPFLNADFNGSLLFPAGLPTLF